MGEDAAFTQAIWIGLVSIVATVAGLLLVDKPGRRPLIIWGMAWIIASLGLCSFGFDDVRYQLSEETVAMVVAETGNAQFAVLAGVEFESDIAFNGAVKEALGEEEATGRLTVLLQEATRMNATLVLCGIHSFMAAFQFSVGPVIWVLFSEILPIGVRGMAIPFFTIVTSALVQSFFPWQLENMGMSSIFLFYAATVLVGMVILFFTLKQTKNLSMEEIQASLQSG